MQPEEICSRQVRHWHVTSHNLMRAVARIPPGRGLWRFGTIAERIGRSASTVSRELRRRRALEVSRPGYRATLPYAGSTPEWKYQCWLAMLWQSHQATTSVVGLLSPLRLC